MVVKSYPEVRKTDTLDRVHEVHPNNSEGFHLRMLVHIAKGPPSFISLNTFQGITYESFQGVCKAVSLLEDDTHWESMLSEAALRYSAESLRYLFAIMISFCQVTDLYLLWQNYRESMAEDILHS